MFALQINSLNLLYILLFCLVIYYVIFIYKNWKLVKFASKEKWFFVPMLPLFGHTYVLLLTGRVNIVSGLEMISNWFGFPIAGWYGSSLLYISTDPSEIKIILNHPQCYGKGQIYKKINLLFIKTLILVPYEEWKPRRRLYQRSYKPNVLKMFCPSFYKQSCEFVENIRKMKKEQDLFDFCNKYSINNFINTSANLKENEVLTKFCNFESILIKGQEEFVRLMMDTITPAKLWYKYSPAGKRLSNYVKQAKELINLLIKVKRKQFVNDKVYDETSGVPIPLLDLMMDMNDEEIFEELFLFAAAATDTTGHSLAFAFTLLGMNPKVQESLYEEVISVVGDGVVSYEDLPNLKYTEAVICETLRLFPPGPAISRSVNADVDVGTKILPKGIDFAVNIFHLHREPKYWKDPLRFDPTRFLPENASQIQPYSYLPFSAGPRDCIGKGQAMMLLKITVANVIRKFSISSKYKSIDEITLTSGITLKSTHSLDCHFKPRLTK